MLQLLREKVMSQELEVDCGISTVLLAWDHYILDWASRLSDEVALLTSIILQTLCLIQHED